jgi:hypothetical protein
MTVVDNYFPFDTGSGASATPARWRLMARLWYSSGVVPGYLNACVPSISGSVVTIQSGAMWIDGYYGESDSPKTVGVSGNGMVVARMDPTARSIAFYYVAGQSVPTQNPNGIYEIPIMQVTGATGTDIRRFSAPTPSNPVHARACRVAAYATSTSLLTYGWDTISFGTGFAGGIYTCPINGDYIVAVQIGFTSTGAGQWCAMHLVHNSTALVWTGTTASTGANEAQLAQLSEVVPCAAGDILFINHYYSTNGCAGLVGSMYAYMTVRAIP